MNDIYKALIEYWQGEIERKRLEYIDKENMLSECLDSKKSVAIMCDLNLLNHDMQELKQAIRVHENLD